MSVSEGIAVPLYWASIGVLLVGGVPVLVRLFLFPVVSRLLTAAAIAGAPLVVIGFPAAMLAAFGIGNRWWAAVVVLLAALAVLATVVAWLAHRWASLPDTALV